MSESGGMSRSEHRVFVHGLIRRPLERVWDAWADSGQMSTWFSEGTRQDFRVGGRYENGDHDAGTFLEIEPMESIRFTWEQKIHHPGSVVEVRFESASAEETEVQIHHTDLFDESEVENLTEGWSWALDSLKNYLEKGRPIGFDEWKAGD